MSVLRFVDTTLCWYKVAWLTGDGLNMKKAWINGVSCQTTSILDRGLAYGDGLFETLLYTSGQVMLLEAHLARLQAGAERLRLPFALDVLQNELQSFLCEAVAEGLLGHSGTAVVKIILSRGVGGRGYAFPQDHQSATQRALLLFDHPNYPCSYREEGVEIRFCDTPVSVNAALAGLKHLNRLDSVMARNEWNDPHIVEGLMLDDSGFVIEGTMSNLFMVKDDVLITPLLHRAGVEGVMRAHVLNLADQHKVETRIKVNLRTEQLLDADEVFICNSVFGVWPVTQLESKQWPVGTLTQAFQCWMGG